MKQKKKTNSAAVKPAVSLPVQAPENSAAHAAVPAPCSVPAVTLRDGRSFGRFPGWVLPAFLGVALYFCLYLPTGRFSMVMVFTALALSLVFCKSASANLRERAGIPALLMLGWFFWLGASAIYATGGMNASDEFVKSLAAIPLALLALLFVERHHLRVLFWIMAAMAAFMGLICVDSSATGVLYGAFCAVMDALGANFGSLSQYVGAGRINGIYNNANIIASIFALGGLLAIWLTRSGGKKWEKPLGAFLTGVLAMAFFLSMSRGAILCFGAAMIVYVIATGKEDRLSLSVFLVETVVVTILLSALAMKFLGEIGSAIPVLLTLLCGVVLYGLDRFVGAPVSARLAGKGKLIALTCGGLVTAVVVYAVAALNITGPYTFAASGQRLYRTVELPAGAYTLDVECSGQISGEINAVLTRDSVRYSHETLFEGVLEDGITVVVPEGAQLIQLAFYGDTGDAITAMAFSDGTEVELGFPLIPSFLANRLQEGLLTGSSFAMRSQYVEDGLKLFAQRPLLGFGLGGTQTWLMRVQPFFYESKFLHNDIVQIMADQGAVGLVLFMGMMLGTAWLLLRRLRQERDPLAAVLLACWVMMNLHSVMEINFSHRGYQTYAYLLLVLMLAAFPVTLKLPAREVKRVGTGTAAAVLVWLAFFGISYQAHRLAHHGIENLQVLSNEQVMNDLHQYSTMDLYDPEDARAYFMANALALEDPRYHSDMVRYADWLRNSGTRYACTSVAYSYYMPQGDLEQMFACVNEGIMNYAAHRDVWNLELLEYFESVLPQLSPDQFPDFVKGVQSTLTMLEEFNEGRMEPIDLALLVQEYVDKLEEVAELPAEQGYQEMMALVMEKNSEL